MQVVVNALVGALPSIFNVLLVCLIFWLIFAIIGVNTFMGRFFKCMELDTGSKFSHEVIPNKTVCLQEKELHGNADWVNGRVTYDNVFIAYLALFQVRHKASSFKSDFKNQYSASSSFRLLPSRAGSTS